MEIRRTFDILYRLQTDFKKSELLNAKHPKGWQALSTSDFFNRAHWLAAALIDAGFQKGDRVALMAGNMPEWNIADYGCQLAGLPTVPIYPTLSNTDLIYILNHSAAKLIFISDRAVLKKILAVKSQTPIEHIISFTPLDNTIALEHFAQKDMYLKHEAALQQRISEITAEDLLSILYTSGTTGTPKGVMIRHAQMVANILACKDIIPFKQTWKALSFLPLNHVFERMVNTLYLYHGIGIYYAESLEKIGDNAREIKPDVFVAVPRLLEKVMDRILQTGEKLNGIKKYLFNWSIALAKRYELNNKNGLWYAIQRQIADTLIYSKWRAAIGGNIKVIASGGSALNPNLECMFSCAGITILQGYGLTETCVVVSINRSDAAQRKFGSVGIVLSNSEVKIADDGEILFRGPSVMSGYYLNPEATREVLDAEGWFSTGDVGHIAENKFLVITDRKKELFKNSGGKYISPVYLENKLKECRYIEHCMVIGEDQKFASALILPNTNAFVAYCQDMDIRYDAAPIHEHPVLKDLIQQHVNAINPTLGAYEQIKRHRIVQGHWSVESGEITPKLSLKRKIIAQKYSSVIQEIFRQ